MKSLNNKVFVFEVVNNDDNLELMNRNFEEILKKEGINLRRLNEKEIYELTNSLNFIPD
ncbi:MAG: hypothetical protein NUV46_04340 [Nanoarchaeota archaeon]|nr:hypothetical protein [Nanoarchaeota archaeon]